MPYEAEAAGKIHLRAAEGETVRVGDMIALIGELGTDQSASPSGPGRAGVARRSRPVRLRHTWAPIRLREMTWVNGPPQTAAGLAATRLG